MPEREVRMNFWKGLLRRKRLDGELEEELRVHLVLATRDRMERGDTPEDAAHHARRELGNLLRVKESTRETWGWSSIERLSQDFKYILRGFRKSPGFTAAAIAIFAIGLGSSTAVFSAVDPLLFRPLPFADANRLVSYGILAPIDTNEFLMAGAYLEWRGARTGFESVTSMQPAADCDVGASPPLRLRCASVEANFLDLLGVAPAIGRNFRPEENRPGVPRAAIISYALWTGAFGSDPNIQNRTVRVDDEPMRIAGVLPRNFEMPQGGLVDILLPAQWSAVRARSGATILLRTFARLRNEVSVEQAREQLQPLFAESLKSVPYELSKEAKLVVQPLRERRIHAVKAASWMLLGAVLALLSLACANAANLMLARSAARSRERAMRAILGASRKRLLQQKLLESLALGVAGGILGCGMARALVALFTAMAPEGTMGLGQARVDPRALGFALGASILAALLAGMAPALERVGPQSIAGWQAIGSPATVFRKALVAAQVAISVVLVAGALQFGRSLRNLEAQTMGFAPEQVTLASFLAPGQRYPTAASRAAFYRELEEHLRMIPGGGVFALSDTVPPGGGMHGRPYANIHVAGHPPLKGGGMVAFRYVTPGYFRAMGIRIIAGRGFHESERLSGETPLILSQTLARRIFGAENPIGQQVELSGDGKYSPILGVAEDVKNSGLAEAAAPEYYRLRVDSGIGLGTGAVAIFRTSLDEKALAPWIRQEIAAVDASLPVTIQTMDARMSAFESQPRLVTALVGLFAFFGVTLAAVGLYAVISFLVTQRRREIGVRIALGADPVRIAEVVGASTLAWAAAGAGVGLGVSLAVSRLIRRLLFETSPQDPAALTVAVVILALAVAAATAIPAWRAARVDPAIALRND
jgi:putative ABC transport system permease protein